MNTRQKVALVSGSSRGIGKGIALKIAQSGYKVYVNGRNAAAVHETVNLIKSQNGKAEGLISDLTQETAIITALQNIRTVDGELDAVVANIGSGSSIAGWDIPGNEYRRVFEINLLSCITLCTQAIPFMKTGGSLVAISSIAGCEPLGAPIAYSVAKAGVISFVENFARGIAAQGLRINALSPGNVLTDEPTNVWNKKLTEDRTNTLSYIRREVPMNGFARVEDIAQGVEYLLGSRFVTGINLVIDGGQLR